MISYKKYITNQLIWQRTQPTDAPPITTNQ